MAKKTVTFLLFLLAFLTVLNLNSANLLAQATGGFVADDKQTKQLSSITGISAFQLGKYGVSVDTVIKIYAAAAVTGSSFQVVFENSDSGVDLPKFYKKYSVSPNMQATSANKYNTLKIQLLGNSQAKDAYTGLNKKGMADYMSLKTGISSGSIMDYGFGSGLPAVEILNCCILASKSGNSLSTVIKMRQDKGDFNAVYDALLLTTAKRMAINATIGILTPQLDASGKFSSANKPLSNITDLFKKEAVTISKATGISESRIIEAMRKGVWINDIVKCVAISRKVGGSFESIVDVFVQGGWPMVDARFGLNNKLTQGDISKNIGEINAKMNPGKAPIDKKELVNGK